MSDKLKVKLVNRTDTKENWESVNPVLLEGEFGIEKENDIISGFKIGDGKTAWNDLKYAKVGSAEDSVDVPEHERTKIIVNSEKHRVYNNEIIYFNEKDVVKFESHWFKDNVKFFWAIVVPGTQLTYDHIIPAKNQWESEKYEERIVTFKKSHIIPVKLEWRGVNQYAPPVSRFIFPESIIEEDQAQGSKDEVIKYIDAIKTAGIQPDELVTLLKKVKDMPSN